MRNFVSLPEAKNVDCVWQKDFLFYG